MEQGAGGAAVHALVLVRQVTVAAVEESLAGGRKDLGGESKEGPDPDSCLQWVSWYG